MKSRNQGTKEKIYLKALELFNKRGIAEVGVREIARLLQISPGNMVYYYPCKNDLIADLFKAFLENFPPYEYTKHSDLKQVAYFFKFLKSFLLYQDQYKCLFTDLPTIMEVPKLLVDMQNADKLRNTELQNVLAVFIDLGILNDKTGTENILTEQLLMVIRYRYLNGRLYYPLSSTSENTKSTFKKILDIFMFFSTQKGSEIITKLSIDWERT